MNIILNKADMDLAANKEHLIHEFLAQHNLSLDSAEDYYGSAAVALCQAVFFISHYWKPNCEYIDSFIKMFMMAATKYHINTEERFIKKINDEHAFLRLFKAAKLPEEEMMDLQSIFYIINMIIERGND